MPALKVWNGTQWIWVSQPVVSLDQLADVTVTSPATGKVIRWDGAVWRDANLAASDITSGVFSTARLGSGTANATTWLRGDGTWATISAGSSDLTGLTDVTITTPAEGQFLRRNGTEWVNDELVPIQTSAPTAPDGSLWWDSDEPAGTDTAVHITGDETIAGIKTFTSPIKQSVSGAYPIYGDAVSGRSERIWFDRVRFSSPVNEYSTDGTTWNVQTEYGREVLDGRNSSVYGFYDNSRWSRWTFNGLAWSSTTRLFLSFGYVAPSAAMNVLVESSVDGSAWTTRGSGTCASASYGSYALAFTDAGGDNLIRVTLQTVGGVASGLNCLLRRMELQSARPGEQGSGPEFELPYDWGVDKDITMPASLTVAGDLINPATDAVRTGRLASYGKVITDWDAATESGTYVAEPTVANRPPGNPATYWWMGTVVSANANEWTQAVWQLHSPHIRWQRTCVAGVKSEWHSLPSSRQQTEFDGNLVLNGDFESYDGAMALGWRLVTGNAYPESSGFGRVSGDKGLTLTNATRIVTRSPILVKPGERLAWSVWQASTDATSTRYMRAVFLDSEQDYRADPFSYGSYVDLVPSSETVPVGGKLYSGSFVVPAGKWWMHIMVSHSGSYMGMDDLKVTRDIVGDYQIPSRLGPRGNVANFTDWNKAVAAGWYSAEAAANAPGAGWWLARVETHDDQATNTYVTQTAWQFTAQTASDTAVYKRYCTPSGGWSSWFKLMESQVELDARYVSRTQGGREAVSTITGATGTWTLDTSIASVFVASSVSGNITLATSNVPTGVACTITVVINQGGTVRTVTMPAGAVWLGSAPTQAANKKCVITMMTTDGGTSWLCSGAVQA